MTARILPFEEWSKLAHTDLVSALPDLDPARVQILVIEDNADVIGCWAMAWCLHAECLWIDPQRRGKGGVLRKLLRAMRTFAPHVFSLVDADTVVMAEKFGGIPLEGAPFLLPLRDV